MKVHRRGKPNFNSHQSSSSWNIGLSNRSRSQRGMQVNLYSGVKNINDKTRNLPRGSQTLNRFHNCLSEKSVSEYRNPLNSRSASEIFDRGHGRNKSFGNYFGQLRVNSRINYLFKSVRNSPNLRKRKKIQKKLYKNELKKVERKSKNSSPNLQHLLLRRDKSHSTEKSKENKLQKSEPKMKQSSKLQASKIKG